MFTLNWLWHHHQTRWYIAASHEAMRGDVQKVLSLTPIGSLELLKLAQMQLVGIYEMSRLISVSDEY